MFIKSAIIKERLTQYLQTKYKLIQVRMGEWWQQGEPGGQQTIVNQPLLFCPGYNCRIYPRVGNRLQFEAVGGLGQGEVATDLSKGFAEVSGTMIHEEETIPANYLRKDGLPNESEVLYAFCGALGPHVRMAATSTIRLTAEPEKHGITISVGNLGGDICSQTMKPLANGTMTQ